MLEDVGFEVTEEIQTGDLTTVKEDQSIEGAKGLTFRIKKAAVRPVREDNKKEAPHDASNPVIKKFLSLDVVLTEGGVDGTGRYAGKHFFPDVLVWVDVTHKFYAEKERYTLPTKPYLADWKRLVEALGYDVSAPPAINDAFLEEILGREVTADLTREEIRVPDDQGQWHGSGDYKNLLRRVRKVS